MLGGDGAAAQHHASCCVVRITSKSLASYLGNQERIGLVLKIISDDLCQHCSFTMDPLCTMLVGVSGNWVYDARC